MKNFGANTTTISNYSVSFDVDSAEFSPIPKSQEIDGVSISILHNHPQTGRVSHSQNNITFHL